MAEDTLSSNATEPLPPMQTDVRVYIEELDIVVSHKLLELDPVRPTEVRFIAMDKRMTFPLEGAFEFDDDEGAPRVTVSEDRTIATLHVDPRQLGVLGYRVHTLLASKRITLTSQPLTLSVTRQSVPRAGKKRGWLRVEIVEDDGALTITPDPLVVLGAIGKCKIEWHLSSANYQFAVDGIRVLGDGNDEFEYDYHSDDVYRLRNDNKLAKTYKYEIRLRRRYSGTHATVFDPTIRNGAN